jgi:hypothetical protein
MNLIANGCSFTAGVPDDMDFLKFKEVYTNIENFHSYGRVAETSWPYQVPNVNAYNMGLGGSGNFRILRTMLSLLDTVSQDFIDDTVFVIQWSSIFRNEYWNQHGIIFDVHDETSANSITPHTVTEPYSHDDDDRQIIDSDLITNVANYKFLAKTLSQNLYESLCAIITLTHALQYRNAKFIYTSLQWNNLAIRDDFFLNSIPEDFELSPYHTALINMMPQENMIQSMFEFLHHLDPVDNLDNFNNRKYFIKNDGHPNSEGNKLFANYVTQEMEKRNWLT